jgi:hypothetical protein
VALTVALAASTATAWGGTVTLGPSTSDLSGFTANPVGCQASDPGASAHCSIVVANLTPPAGVALTVPDDGTVIAWRGQGTTNQATQQSLLVLRPQGGGSYALAGQSANGNIDGTANSTSLPVQTGDVLGAALSCYSELYSQQLTGATWGYWFAGFPNPPAGTMANEIGLNATVNVASPVVTSISPTSGGLSGGNTMTITGQHLANANYVSFGSPVANPVSNTNNQIVVTVPQGETTQTVHVQVTTAGGTSAVSSADAYTYLAERKLHVSVSGSGTVMGNGISCPGDCNETYLDGTQVSLSAAADSGSTFTGWGGACSGSGACDVTMGADHDVSATFAQNQPPPPPPNTRISQATIDSAKGKATFKFKSAGSATRFQCAVKRKRRGTKPPPPKACQSPKTYKHLKPGKYLFAVRAVGPGGPDPTPAKKSFKIG